LGPNLLFVVFAINILIFLFYMFANIFSIRAKNVLKILILLISVIGFAFLMNKYASTSALYSSFQNNGGSKVAYITVTELYPTNTGTVIADEGFVSVIAPLFYP